jgi:hypothetical protein
MTSTTTITTMMTRTTNMPAIITTTTGVAAAYVLQAAGALACFRLRCLQLVTCDMSPPAGVSEAHARTNKGTQFNTRGGNRGSEPVGSTAHPVEYALHTRSDTLTPPAGRHHREVKTNTSTAHAVNKATK